MKYIKRGFGIFILLSLIVWKPISDMAAAGVDFVHVVGVVCLLLVGLAVVFSVLGFAGWLIISSFGEE